MTVKCCRAFTISVATAAALVIKETSQIIFYNTCITEGGLKWKESKLIVYNNKNRKKERKRRINKNELSSFHRKVDCCGSLHKQIISTMEQKKKNTCHLLLNSQKFMRKSSKFNRNEMWQFIFFFILFFLRNNNNSTIIAGNNSFNKHTRKKEREKEK